MSSRTTRMMKEARALFRPWCAVMIAGALPLVLPRSHPILLGINVRDISTIAVGFGILLLATLSLGNEFQHRTLSLLLTQPVGRLEIWGEKMSVTLVAVLSAALVLSYAWRSTLQQDPKLWVFGGAVFLTTVPSATFGTLFARSPMGGLLVNSLPAYFVILPAVNWKWILGPNPSPARSITALSTVAFAALGYAGVMLWLGGRKLARFQVTGGMAGDDLLMAGPSLMPEAWAEWFRFRPARPVLNLIRKELRLLRPLWLVTPPFLVYLTCLMVIRFMLYGEWEAPRPVGISVALLFTPVIVFTPLIAILAGSLSLGEERASGTHSWHMTLSVSARRQWLIKLLTAMFTGVVCALLLPVFVMVLVGFVFGSPFMFVELAMSGLIIFGGSIFGLPVLFLGHAIPGSLLTALVLTLASFWCASAVNGTARAALWFAPAMSAVLFAGRCGGWIAPKLVALAVSRFDPFTHFQFTNAVLNLQLFVIGLMPLRIERTYFLVVTILLVPTLLIAVIQSYRLFREQAQDSIWSVIRNLVPLAITAFLTVFCWAAFPGLTDQTNGTIVYSGETRQYLLYVPKTYDRSKATPLVISMHPAGGWPVLQMEISRWNDLADEHSFLVVYPSGTDVPKHWGEELGEELDVKFISDLLDKLEARYNIDPNRIYADGMSNGGGMAFALSCRLSDRIAAIGAVAAAQFVPWNCFGVSRPVPTVAFHGTADPVALYQGGLSAISPGRFQNIRDWTARVARRNRCSGDPSDARITASVRRLAYTNCAENADVILYTVEGGGHTWPGGKPLPERMVGPTIREISATNLMWEFFVRHPRGPK